MDQAMRKTTTLALIVATGLAHAQVWCPVGAVWNYNLMSFMVEGCETRTYVGDTVIDGRIAQRITVSSLVMNYMTNQTESYQSIGSARCPVIAGIPPALMPSAQDKNLRECWKWLIQVR
jgi:hypothetical protein